MFNIKINRNFERVLRNYVKMIHLLLVKTSKCKVHYILDYKLESNFC